MDFFIENILWVSAARMLGENDTEADQQSRILKDVT